MTPHCAACGLPEYVWVHHTDHPAVRNNPAAHAFVNQSSVLVVPTKKPDSIVREVLWYVAVLGFFVVLLALSGGPS